MGVSYKQFLKRLTASEIVSSDEAAKLDGIADDMQHDAERLAKNLIEKKVLTRFQAAVLLKARATALTIGEYLLLDRLGAGGMGVVYKARHRRMERLVAIKVLSRQSTRTDDSVRRFYREIKALAKLQHPNIVIAHDASEYQGSHYLVMEYVKGRDLAGVVDQDGPLPVKLAIDYVLQAARGLEYSHQHGIIHRDIKPANMVLANDGTVKLLDLGLARLNGDQQSSDEVTLTKSCNITGTVNYMAPEHAANAKHADERSDIYSLGCTLYRILTGNAPFKGDTAIEVIVASREQPIPQISSEAPASWQLPEGLQNVFELMLAKRPEDRYQSMGEVIADLEYCAANISDSGNSYVVPAGTEIASQESSKPKSAFGGTSMSAFSDLEPTRQVDAHTTPGATANAPGAYPQALYGLPGANQGISKPVIVATITSSAIVIAFMLITFIVMSVTDQEPNRTEAMRPEFVPSHEEPYTAPQPQPQPRHEPDPEPVESPKREATPSRNDDQWRNDDRPDQRNDQRFDPRNDPRYDPRNDPRNDPRFNHPNHRDEHHEGDDLFEAIQLNEKRMPKGEWVWERGDLVSAPRTESVLLIPYEMPQRYEMRVSFMQHENVKNERGSFAMNLPFHGLRFNAVIDARDGEGKLFGGVKQMIEGPDGKPLSRKSNKPLLIEEQRIYEKPQIIPGRTHHLSIAVEYEFIQIRMDGRLVLEWQAPRFGPRRNQAMQREPQKDQQRMIAIRVGGATDIHGLFMVEFPDHHFDPNDQRHGSHDPRDDENEGERKWKKPLNFLRDRFSPQEDKPEDNKR